MTDESGLATLRDPRRAFCGVLLLVATAAGADTQQAAGDVERLACAGMAGPLTGTDGERKATAYVASVFDQLGPMPGGDGDSYFQPFTFTAGAETEVVVLRNGGPLSVPVVPGARE